MGGDRIVLLCGPPRRGARDRRDWTFGGSGGGTWVCGVSGRCGPGWWYWRLSRLVHTWQHRLLRSGDLARKAQESIGANGRTFLLFRFEVGVYDLVAQTICAPGYLVIGPVLSSVCLKAGILEDSTQRGLPKEAHKITGFNGVFNTQEAFEVACVRVPISEDYVKVGQQEIV